MQAHATTLVTFAIFALALIPALLVAWTLQRVAPDWFARSVGVVVGWLALGGSRCGATAALGVGVRAERALAAGVGDASASAPRHTHRSLFPDSPRGRAFKPHHALKKPADRPRGIA
jgi:hypothetical protein